MVANWAHNPEVRGSNPLSATFFSLGLITPERITLLAYSSNYLEVRQEKSLNTEIHTLLV